MHGGLNNGRSWRIWPPSPRCDGSCSVDWPISKDLNGKIITLEAVCHDEVVGVETKASELIVGALHVRPDFLPVDVLAPLAVEVQS